MLGPGELVEAGDNTRIAKLGADEVPAGVRNMGILDTEDQCDFTLEVTKKIQGVSGIWWRRWRGVGSGVWAESARMNVSCKV